MNTFFTEADWHRLEQNWMDWWNGDLKRPLLMASRGTDQSRPFPEWWCQRIGGISFDHTPEEIAEELYYNLSHQKYYGDAWPKAWVDFGPGIAAGFLGGDVNADSQTMWFTPGRWTGCEMKDIRLEYDENNVWWQRVQAITHACVKRFGRDAMVGFTDIGGGLDIAASLRDTQTLLMDTIDFPEDLDAFSCEITQKWLKYFDEQCQVIEPVGRGTSPWAAIWSPKKCYMLQCDFSYMISPDDFARWVAPDVQTCCQHMDHGFYHLDGKGEIPHLEHLLAIPELKGIQWIPGDGQPCSVDPCWWPMLKRIREAGKLVQLYSPADKVLEMAKEVSLEGFAFGLECIQGNPQDIMDAIWAASEASAKRATAACN